MDVLEDSAAALPLSSENVLTPAILRPSADTQVQGPDTVGPSDEGKTGEEAEAKVDSQSMNDGEKHAGENVAGDRDGNQEDNGEQDDASVMSELSQEGFHVSLQGDMLEALDSIESPGTFAALNRLNRGSIPPIYVRDVGNISMPLSEAQAQAIIAQSRQAPYGKGNQTLVDTSVRNTWELDPDQFELQGDSWVPLIRFMCDSICSGAGLGHVKVRAELYKMLLYEKGAMFKAHTDTEKIPGMFGTLVLSLPSAHISGDVVVKHRGETRVFKTSEEADCFLWWFSDVHHEVLPVVSGYRWVLTFNLAIDPASAPSNPPSAAQLGAQVKENKSLRHALRRWLSAPHSKRDAPVLYYGLDHEYTFANVSHRGLKTRDMAVVNALQQLSLGMPFEVFLAVLEKKTIGSCESDYGYGGYGNNHWCDDEEDEDDDEESESHHPIDDIIDTEYTIEKLVALSGQQMGSNMNFDLEHAVQGDEFFPEDPDHEEYEGYMGNSGPEATHWYKKSAVVIVPTDHLLEYLAGYTLYGKENTVRLEALTVFFRERCIDLAKKDSREARHLWGDFYRAVIVSHSGLADFAPQANAKTVELVLCTTLKLGDWTLWKELVSAVVSARVDINLSFFAWLRREILTEDLAWDAIEEGLSTLLGSLPELAALYEAIKEFVNIGTDNDIPFETSHIVRAVDWARRTIARCITTSSRPLGNKDGPAMVNLVFDKRFGLGFDFLKKSIVPVFHKKILDFGFSLNFVTKLHHYCVPNQRSPVNNQAEVLELYKGLVTALIDVLDISVLHSHEALQAQQESATKAVRASHPYLSYASSQRVATATTLQQSESTVNGRTVLTFLVQVITEAFPSATVLKLFLRLTDQASKVKGTEFHFLWLPVLRGLITSLEKKGKMLATPRNQQLYAAFLEAYLKNYVGTEPSRERNLVRPRVRCSCKDCTRLNEFLRSAHQETGRFPMGKQRRQHLHQQLDSLRIDCTHETERYGNPQTLVVSKTSRAQTQAIQNWETRRDNAKQQVKYFDQAKLREVLGSDYDPIIQSFGLGAATAPVASGRRIAQARTLSQPLPQAPRQSSQPAHPGEDQEGQLRDQFGRYLASMTGNRGPNPSPSMPPYLSGGEPSAGTKRKIGDKDAEVIDLT